MLPPKPPQKPQDQELKVITSKSPTNRRLGPTTRAMATKIQKDWIHLLMVEKPPNICSKMP